MAYKPPIILALGPVTAPPGAIIIDYRNHAFWRDHECRMIQPFIGRQPTTFRVIAALLVASPAALLHEEMLEAIYGDDPGGGPDWAEGCIAQAVIRHRDLIYWLGAKVLSRAKFGHRLEFFEPAVLRRAA